MNIPLDKDGRGDIIHQTHPSKRDQFNRSEKIDSTKLPKRMRHLKTSTNLHTPLLSMLYNLHRMESSIYETLHTLGVERDSLPPPYGLGNSSKVAESVSSDEYKADPIEQYVAITLGSPAAPSFDEKVSVLEGILHWLERSSRSGGTKSLKMSDAKGRRILATMLVSYGAGRDQISICGSEEGPNSQPAPPGRRHRSEGVEDASSSRFEGVTANGEMTFLGSFGMATVKVWRKYKKHIDASLQKMKVLSKSIPNTNRPNLSSHLRSIQDTDKRSQLNSEVRPFQSLQRDYTEVILMQDALATCQQRVHRELTSLEDALDAYCEEALIVNQQEQQFLENVELFQKEYHALKELRYRIKKICSLVLK